MTHSMRLSALGTGAASLLLALILTSRTANGSGYCIADGVALCNIAAVECECAPCSGYTLIPVELPWVYAAEQGRTGMTQIVAVCLWKRACVLGPPNHAKCGSYWSERENMWVPFDDCIGESTTVNVYTPISYVATGDDCDCTGPLP